MERNVVIRSLIHLVGMSIPFLVGIFGRVLVLSAISILALLQLLSEFVRPGGKRLPILGSIVALARKHDGKLETAPIFFGIGVSITLVVFEADIGFAAIAIISIGDMSAKLAGAQFGRHPILFNKRKTIEGSIVGFSLAFLGALIFIPVAPALIGAAVGMLVEALPVRIDDNLSVPLAAGLSITGFQFLVGF